MSLVDINIKSEYRSLIDNVVDDFYIPVLKESILYQRAVGFFSSSALIAISKGVEGLIRKGGKIQIIASPRLSQEDIDEISKGYEVRKILERALLRGIKPNNSVEDASRLSYIASLIANGVLDIKIAFLSSNNEIAMYHEKMGIMSDNEGNAIAFSGSMNESENAFSVNYESFDVFCSQRLQRIVFTLSMTRCGNIPILQFPKRICCQLTRCFCLLTSKSGHIKRTQFKIGKEKVIAASMTWQRVQEKP